MKRNLVSVILVVACGTVLSGADWLGFRGPNGTSVSEEKGLPVTWSETENIAWKAELPGRGLSGPIVVGPRVFLTCNSGAEQDRLHVLCFDAKGGARLWERQFWATGRTVCHPKTCMAAPTPASDGERVFALFATGDLVCLDLEGNLLWFRGLAHDYPTVGNNVGMASSPTVWRDLVIVFMENDGESFAAGIDAKTGENRWKIERQRTTNYASPLVMRGEGGSGDVLLLQSGAGLTAHDPATGREAWAYKSGASTIPSATASDGVVFVPSAGLTALRPRAGGGPPEVLWKSLRLAPSTSSPVVYGGRVFVLGGAGIVSCADAANGRVLWQLRLKGSFSSTPVAADGRLYFFNEDGLAQVVDPSGKGNIVGTSELGETILATPAVAGGAIYVRSDKHLWKIKQK